MGDIVNRRPLLAGETDSDYEIENDTSDETPSETEQNASNDVNSLLRIREPMDRYNMAYIIFYLLGMTTLLPWNFFITADNYWMYKLRDVNNTSPGVSPNRTTMQAEFTAYLSVASTVPNTFVLILNTLLSHRIPLQMRMVGSLASIIVLFVTTTAFVKVDTDLWQETFFIETLATVVFLNIASAVMGGGLFGIVGKFSARYITAVVSGQALGGIVAALAEIASLWLGASATVSAFVYFMAADVILVVALVSYVILSKTVFFRYHMHQKHEDMSIQGRMDFPTTAGNEISHLAIFKKIWVYGFSLWMTFFVSLSLYPSVTVLVNSTEKGNGRAWNDIYFVPVVGYLIFSTFDYIGRIAAGMLKWPQKRGWIIAVIGVLRLGFVPLILMCNAHPRKNLPVIVDNDLYYTLIVILFAISNGYLANISMIAVPKIVEPFEQETASSMMAAFLGIGLACGSVLGLFMFNGHDTGITGSKYDNVATGLMVLETTAS